MSGFDPHNPALAESAAEALLREALAMGFRLIPFGEILVAVAVREMLRASGAEPVAAMLERMARDARNAEEEAEALL